MGVWIGYIAAICTTVSFVPQVIQVINTNNTSGISLGMYIIFCIGISCWLIYGLSLGDVPMIAANLVTLVLALIILAYLLKHRFFSK